MDEFKEIREKKLNEMTKKSSKKQVYHDRPLQGSDENFDDLVKSYLIVVVDFWADWCGPCKIISPIIETLAKEYASRTMFLKVNVDDCPNTASRFGIMSIPTIMIFKEGKVVDSLVGAVPKKVIESKLNNFLK